MPTSLLDPSRASAAVRSGDATPARRHDLEGLRAVAVLGVVVFHLRSSWLPGGFAGVDVFFVLSGFFITAQLSAEVQRRGAVDLRAFWGRRARRLLPASALVALVTLGASAVVVDVLHAASVARDARAAGVFALNWRLADEGTSYFADPAPSPFVHYWSLGVEEQFYLAWPVLVAVLAWTVRRRFTGVPPHRLLLIAIAFVSAWSFWSAQRRTEGPGQPYAYFGTDARVWQLGVGAALALGAVRIARLPNGWRVPVRTLGLTTVVAFYLGAPVDIVYPGWWSLLPAGGAAAVVLAGIGETGSSRRDPLRRDPVHRDPVHRVLAAAPAQAIGRYSYSWYLWHWPPLVLLPSALGHPLHLRGLLFCGAATFGLAVITHQLVENPVRTNPRLALRRGRGSLVLGAVLVGVVCLGAAGAVGAAEHRAGQTGIRTVDGARLVPQPAVAAGELPAPSRDGCEVALSSAALSGDCRYLPTTPSGDVVLTGDSHAVQWFPAVRSVAAAHGWGLRVWARASCPLAEVTKVLHGVPARECNRWRADVMKRLVAARPSLVIIGGYASVVPSLYDPASGRLVGGAAARALYESGLRRQLARLRGAGIHVLLIRDTPSFDVGGPQCALAHDRHPAACSSTLRHALRSAADLHAARAVAGVAVLDLTRVFCRRQRCHQIIGSTLAYRDTNHLTREMVNRLRGRVDLATRAASRVR